MLAMKPETRLVLSPNVLLHAVPSADWYGAFDVASGDHFRLNKTAYWVLETIGSGVKMGDLRDKFLERFDVDPLTGDIDLADVLRQFLDNGLVLVKEGS